MRKAQHPARPTPYQLTASPCGGVLTLISHWPSHSKKTASLAAPYGPALPGAEDQSANDQWPEGPRLRDGGDNVAIQGHGAIQRKGSAVYVCSGIQGNALVGENTAKKQRFCAEGCGGADLPIYVASLSAVDQENRRTAGGHERAPNLKIEARIGVVLAVELEYAGQLGSRGKVINAWREYE